MGLDLTLLPLDSDSDSIRYSHTVIQCGWASRLFDLLADVESTPLSVSPQSDIFTCYMARLYPGTDHESTGYGEVTEDAYGQPIRCVTSGQLQSVMLGTPSIMSDSPRNRAAYAYLHALPDNTRVALYWH